jgi:1,4-alpha-glucan branching enzyme
MSNANFWLDRYHIDGLRVDAVASMLHLDYGRKQGEWIPNKYGGREDLDAVDFLRTTNVSIYQQHPDVQTMAEESTSWPMVSRPVYLGGLGFGLKWDMGWMHDTLDYMAVDPVFRRYHHHKLTFRSMYHLSENFVLPLSHDEVVHGKGSLLRKMTGDDWQRFANLRALYAYQYAHPGKKLLFMGGEFGQWAEWGEGRSLDWHLLESGGEGGAQAPLHRGLRNTLRDLNRLYGTLSALHQLDSQPRGFDWIEHGDAQHSVIAFLRRGIEPGDVVAAVCNFTPVVREAYPIGVPVPGEWEEVLNTDSARYGGSGIGNTGASLLALPGQRSGRFGQHLSLTLPPLSVLYLRPREE